MSKKVSLWERYLTKEIGIEFKACLYFFAFLFFYCCYLVINKTYSAQILIMAEMIFSTYVMGYVQVYLLNNFDEADSLGVKEIIGIAICTVIYVGESYVLNWFGRELITTLVFMAYIVLMYVCVFFVYKCRRDIDNRILNDELSVFKARNKQ